ncbi:AraC family transcriptional regulator [Sneathiella marina]|uniref:AraC family transcriptional regulator n=1 Tax=Sneathiella marina TaxID=2950108 RepID=A0ABY4W5F2_9PROT|nr:AraC family transcriptional regulator [Sneathiella marina]USG62421.1 AraC family transcriptional regulator [Sneathiella marina]
MKQDIFSHLARNTLPLICNTKETPTKKREDHWREVFGGLWGPLDLQNIGAQSMSGSLFSKKIGQLTFSRIEFENQAFERTKSDLRRVEEPFYSLAFPDSGQAICQIGGKTAQLIPQHVFLLNNDMEAKLRVEDSYTTLNVKIPTRALEDRLGRRTDIFEKAIENPDAIYHMMQRMIGDLLEHVEILDDRMTHFMTNQMLDTVSFFLCSGGGMSDDNIAQKAHRARILAYLDEHYWDETLTPLTIAAACNISRSYLYKIFSDGEPVIERLRRRRLELARRFIMANSAGLTMTQIAMNCGFKSSSEFSRLFKLEFGSSPSRYQQALSY